MQYSDPVHRKAFSFYQTKSSSLNFYSVILVSPTNKILLLHRVHTSSAFPSAYVFPGGNLSAFQDGEIPAADSPARHLDSDVYRRAAIRETFEESGILLAKRHKHDTHLIAVRNSKRERVRKAVHANELKLTDWLAERGAELDIGMHRARIVS